MKNSVKKEIEELIKHHYLDCSIEEFRDNSKWFWISYISRLSEDFIREFQNEVYWPKIIFYQKLSENFIRELKDKIDWDLLVKSKELSLDFIRDMEFEGYINMDLLSKYQNRVKDIILYGQE